MIIILKSQKCVLLDNATYINHLWVKSRTLLSVLPLPTSLSPSLPLSCPSLFPAPPSRLLLRSVLQGPCSCEEGAYRRHTNGGINKCYQYIHTLCVGFSIVITCLIELLYIIILSLQTTEEQKAWMYDAFLKKDQWVLHIQSCAQSFRCGDILDLNSTRTFICLLYLCRGGN